MENRLPHSLWALWVPSYAFGLINVPGTFQAFVNDILQDYLDDFVVVYLDNILIYSDTTKEHTAYVKKVL